MMDHRRSSWAGHYALFGTNGSSGRGLPNLFPKLLVSSGGSRTAVEAMVVAVERGSGKGPTASNLLGRYAFAER